MLSRDVGGRIHDVDVAGALSDRSVETDRKIALIIHIVSVIRRRERDDLRAFVIGHFNRCRRCSVNVRGGRDRYRLSPVTQQIVNRRDRERDGRLPIGDRHGSRDRQFCHITAGQCDNNIARWQIVAAYRSRRGATVLTHELLVNGQR